MKKRKKRPRKRPKVAKVQRFETYKDRDRRLLRLGFKTYLDYLYSGYWKVIRFHVYRTKGYQCYGCGAKASQVHHLNYSMATLKGDDISGLYPVCRICHRKIEFKADGRKRSFRDSQKWARKVLKIKRGGC